MQILNLQHVNALELQITYKSLMYSYIVCLGVVVLVGQKMALLPQGAYIRDWTLSREEVQKPEVEQYGGAHYSLNNKKKDFTKFTQNGTKNSPYA